MDLFSRRIVGWSMSDTINSELVQSAMRQALADRRPNVGLIHHSDRHLFSTSGKIYKTFDDAKKDIFNYVEMFYNRKRRHASLGYISPVVYEEMHEMKQNRAA